jgi:hypothetical protein
MSIPSGLSEPGSGSEPSRTIKLSDVANQYLGALQRLFDTFSFALAGSRLTSEEQYDVFAHSAGLMPLKNQRMDYEKARLESGRWLLKHGLTEGLALAAMAMGDCRSICALTDWQKKGSQPPERRVEIFTAERENFSALGLPQKFAQLESEFGLRPETRGCVESIGLLRQVLTVRGGEVTSTETNEGEALRVSFRRVEIVTGDTNLEGTVPVSSRILEKSATFAVGERVSLDKSDQLALITTLAVFIGNLLESVQKFAQTRGAV